MTPLAVDGPLRRLLDTLGNKWTAAVIGLLAHGDARFSDLLAGCQVTPKMLTRVLRDLEEDGIVARGAWPGQTGHPRYQLTARGHTLHGHLKALAGWTEEDVSLQAPEARVATEHASGEFDWGHPRVHLALATAAMPATRQLLAAVFGTPVPTVSQTQVVRDGVTYGLEVCAWRFENMVLELVGSTDNTGPFAEFTRRRPAGIHHFSYYVGRSVDARTRWLAQQADGVVWQHGSYAAYDFQDDLGLNICVSDRTAIPPNSWPVVEIPRGSPFFHVTHLGILVGDIHRALTTYQRVFGGTLPRIRHYTPVFAPAVRSDAHAAVHLATCEQPNVAVQFCEPSGESPFGRFLNGAGNGVFALDFNVGTHLRDVVARLTALGGQVLIESARPAFALVQMPASAGFSIGLFGRPTSNASRTSSGRPAAPTRRSA